MKTKMIWLLFVFMVLLAFSVFSQEDFSITADALVTLCPCSGQTYSISVTNTGTIPSTYRVSLGPENYPWATAYQDEFTLQPKQRIKVPITVNSPCHVSGTASFDFFVSTLQGFTKRITQKYLFMPCYSYTLASSAPEDPVLLDEKKDFAQYTGQYSLCEQQPVVIPVIIENNDSYAPNRYQLSLDGPVWVTLSSPTRDANPSEKTAVFINLNPPPASAGSYNLSILSTTVLGDITNTLEIPLAVESCYGFIMEDKIPSPLCAGNLETQTILLKNTGTKAQHIALEIIGQNWTTLSESEITLAPLSEGRVQIITSPPPDISGEFPVTIRAVSFAHNDSVSRTWSVLPKSTCYNAFLDDIKKITVPYGPHYTPLKIRNTGTKETGYTLELEGPSWIGIEPSEITLRAGQVFTANIYTNATRDILQGNYESVVHLFYADTQTSMKLPLELSEKQTIFSALKNMVRYYKYYFYAALLIIPSILILLWIILLKWKSSEP